MKADNKGNVIRLLRTMMPLVAVVCLVVFPPWMLIWAWLAPLPDTVQDQVEDAVGYGMDGIIVYVDRKGERPVSYAAGYKNRDEKEPADADGLFKIASISKLYMAVAAVKLVNEGELSLDETLAKLLPDLAGRIANAEEITLRMLISHRSGIPNYSDHPDYPWTSPYKEVDETYDLVLDMPADFAPDERYSYSNTNYLLLGEIMDRRLGYSHHEYIRSRILEPLGLNDTYSLLGDVNADEVMSGYFVGYGPDIKGNDFIQPGGSMVSTARDVGVFLRALNDGTLLSAVEQEIYTSVYVYEHTGLLPGYQSIATYDKNMDAVVVQFVNTSGGDMWALSEVVHERILKILRRGGDNE
ncbi:serine hydrolase domain-containing protein [Roseivirga sp. BDSF3-8]|uniref:serine hydrolase domain-containing protein n=1 Tax=Roseivirga sp. BDSF3-8 TaxID=3241598 RepID=UPI0035323196